MRKPLLFLKRLLILIGCIFLTSCQTPTPKGTPITVKRVINGHSLEVMIANHPTPQRIRLIGIEAPHLKQLPWGVQARDYLQQLVSEQPLTLELGIQDQYARKLAYLWHNHTLINETMVKQGYALASPISPNTDYNQPLASAQDYARIMNQGIWNPEKPLRTTPREFCRQNQC